MFPSISYRFTFVILCTLFSCSDNGNYLPGYSGNAGEMVVVMDDARWNSPPGNLIKNTFGQPQYGLPQDEPVFNMVHVSPKNFSKIFQTHRNILFVDFSEKETMVKPEAKTNSWAQGQIVIKITAPNDSAFINFMNQYSENILHKFNTAETERQIEKNKSFGEPKLSGKMNEKYGFSITLQKDCYIAKEDSNFVWLRIERGRNKGGYEHQISQGIFIYWQNYTDTNLFSPEMILTQTDSVSKKYIAGTTPNSFLITSHKLFSPVAKQIKHNNHFAVETRGLWRMENDFMGGPFISITILDEKSNLLITAEGYVFAPQFDKLGYLREVEAIIKSIYLPHR